MMVRDDRLYAFIIAKTSRSRSHIRRVCVHKRWLKISALAAFAVLCAAFYGFYGLTQHLAHLRVEQENEQLRAENEKQRQQLNKLNDRVEAVEDASRRIAVMSGVNNDKQQSFNGAGGPALPLDTATNIAYKTDQLERQLHMFEAVLRQRAESDMTPSIWPVEGRLTDSFGGRHNPFGGYSSEFHAGQDIATLVGTPVAVTGSGTVIFAGWQNGYGQLVVVDHGGGLTTRYGHLSHIDAVLGQNISRGEQVGRVGSTGRSTGPHLHYEVRIDDEPVDPRPYLPGFME